MELDEVELSDEDRYRSSNRVFLGVDVPFVLGLSFKFVGVAGLLELKYSLYVALVSASAGGIHCLGLDA